MTPPLSTLYPRDIAAALQRDAIDWPAESRIARIDQLTDELVRRGFSRPRDDTFLFDARGRIAALWGGEGS